MIYYNEIDDFAIDWLSNLIMEGYLPKGIIDPRPIQEVTPKDLHGFSQCHFFAGIGGWAYALELAGWPEDAPVWTGSCPCQPFSGVGKRKGFEDERHLWPEWFRLIKQCKPPVIFGEQVATASVWLDLVFDGLESQDYSCGAADIPACAVGTRQERQRIWFVADSNKKRWENSEGLPTSKEKADIRPSFGVVPSKKVEHIRGSFKPDKDWIVNGVSGVGNAVGAFGNSIVPQVAAEFIIAYQEAAA